jgi:hypothetical protein
MDGPRRGTALSACAVLFGLLAVSNFSKPLQLGGSQTGFVLLGHRLSGAANAIAGPLFGLYLLIYAVGIWRLRRWALPMAWAYAGYVVANLVLFSLNNPQPRGGVMFVVVYAAIAIGVSTGAGYLLSQRRETLT